MTTKILSEIWDDETSECDGSASFRTVQAFVAEAKKFKKSNASGKSFRAHIPGSFTLSDAEAAQINDLGIELFPVLEGPTVDLEDWPRFLRRMTRFCAA